MSSKDGSFAADFPEWLERTRLGLGLNAQALADKAKLHRGVVARMERGEYSDSALSVYVRLADALEVELGYLLYRAGFDVNREGIDLARVQRIETVTSVFEDILVTVRSALAEAHHLLDGTTILPAPPVDQATTNIAAALAVLDAADVRLHSEQSLTAPSKSIAPRVWTEDEDAILRALDGLSAEDVAARMNRTPDAIRVRRARRLKGQG